MVTKAVKPRSYGKDGVAGKNPTRNAGKKNGFAKKTKAKVAKSRNKS